MLRTILEKYVEKIPEDSILKEEGRLWISKMEKKLLVKGHASFQKVSNRSHRARVFTSHCLNKPQQMDKKKINVDSAAQIRIICHLFLKQIAITG